MIKKWLLRRAPGSPGHTARVWTRSYLKSVYDDKAERLLELILNFQYLQSEVGNLKYSENPIKHMDRCQGCVASLMYALLCDTKNFLNHTTDLENTDLIDVVYKEVSKLAPDAVLVDIQAYRLRCYQYEYLSRIRLAYKKAQS